MANDVPGSGHGLPNTRWTRVEAAGSPETPEGQEALETLLTVYRPALLHHVQGKFWLTREDTEDLLQTFIQKKVLETNLFASADRQRGRFRTYLLQVLDNFVISQLRRQQARKRSIGQAVPLDSLSETELPTVEDTPEEEFEWSAAVIAGALLDMQNQCEREDRAETYEVFLARMLNPILQGVAPVSYDDLVEGYRIQTPAQASKLLHSAKRMFRRHVERVLGYFARDAQEMEDELLRLRRIIRQVETTA